jgi:hypothetical protein
MRLGAALAVLLLTVPALAQKTAPAPLSDSAQGMLGAWELSSADRSKACTVTFRNVHTAVGYRLDFGKDCAAIFEFTVNVAGWIYPEGDLLRLVDGEGRTLSEFSEVEDGIFEAPTPGVGVLFLQNPAAAAAARKQEATPEPERIEEPQGK